MLIKSIASGFFQSKPAFKANVNLSEDQRCVVKHNKVLNEMYKKITSSPTDNVYDLNYCGKRDYSENRDYIEMSIGRPKKFYQVEKNNEVLSVLETNSNLNTDFLKTALSKVLKEEEKEIGQPIKNEIDTSVEELCKKHNLSIEDLIKYLKTKI